MDFGEAPGNLGAKVDALLALGDGVFDFGGGLFRGRGGALGEGADFLGDDGETSPVFAGAGGLDGGVQREDVRLKRDFVDRL